MFLYLLLSVALAACQGQESTLRGTNVAELSDRTLIELLVKRVDGLETERGTQEARIEALEDTVLRQQEVITELQEALGKQGQTEEVESDEVDNTKPEHDETTKEQKSSDRQATVHRIVKNVAKRQVSSTPVAFSALDANDQNHLGAHQNLLFEIANVNTNNVYNPHHGVFTAPLPGIYLITSTVLAMNNREVWCDITVNGSVKAKIYARGTDYRHDQGTHTILLHLKQGDDVAIQNEAVDDAVYGSLYTSFSGFLLYEEEPLAVVG